MINPSMHANGYGFGHLYGMRHGAYSVVVAALCSAQAREAFALFLHDRGVTVAPNVPQLRKARTVGNRPVIVAQSPQAPAIETQATVIASLALAAQLYHDPTPVYDAIQALRPDVDWSQWIGTVETARSERGK